MLCKNCMVTMGIGTTYEQKKDGKTAARRFHECKKYHNKVYTKELNFQEYMNKASDERRNM